MNNKGFTLVEVLAVVMIIALVGTITMPSILTMLNSGKDSSYAILIDNIKTAASEMYQEKDYLNNNIYVFDNNGRTEGLVTITSNSMTVNLQTLAGNGYLMGTSNNNLEVNKNKKIIINPKTNEDLGACEIKITKIKIASGDKTCYKLESVSGNDSICPTTLDFGGESQCTN